VLETYPELVGSYDRVIKNPMDFRTILRSRIGMYNSILELRDDLITVFENCIRFNTIKTEEGQMAWYVYM
jgi:Bromodomain